MSPPLGPSVGHAASKATLPGTYRDHAEPRALSFSSRDTCPLGGGCVPLSMQMGKLRCWVVPARPGKVRWLKSTEPRASTSAACYLLGTFLKIWIPKLCPWPYRSEFQSSIPGRNFFKTSPVTLTQLTHRLGQGTGAFRHCPTWPYRHTATWPHCHAATAPCHVTGAQGTEPQSYRHTILLDLACP